jgi:hypothetical protein
MRRIPYIVALLLCCATAHAAVGFDKAAQSGGSSSKTCTITPAAGGEAIFVVFFSAAAAVTAVSDGVNTGAYIAITSSAISGNSSSVTNVGTTAEWFYHLNVAASSTTITATTTSVSTSCVAVALTGVPTSGSLTAIVNDTRSGTGATTALSTTSLTVSNSGSGLLAAWGDTTGTSITPYITIGTGWTTSANENASWFPMGEEHQVNVSAGTSTVTATARTTSVAWAGTSIAINPVVSAACTPTLSLLGVGRCG